MGLSSSGLALLHGTQGTETLVAPLDQFFRI
jgi:hypothetical protein